ncbi:MAG: AAA family ATPase [Lachnotalea sp.]
MNHFVIAITRTCGSGGTTIGKMLAQNYHINLYDKKLMRLASDDSGISEKIFAAADEDQKRSTLYMASKNVYNGEIISPEEDDFTSNDNLFAYQAKVLKELTKSESYVVIGRGADFVLKDYHHLIRVFIHAPYEKCVQHEMDYMSFSRKEAEKMIAKTDAYRDSYYRHHTGQDWHNVKNYDLSLDTGLYSYEECVKLIQLFVGYIESK